MGLTLLNAMSSQHLLPTHVQALQAVHGAVHQSDVGVKYTWLGNGYISNMYYKWIANHATYNFGHGGDLSFGATIKNKNIEMVAYGDSEGKPRNQTGILIILTIKLHTAKNAKFRLNLLHQDGEQVACIFGIQLRVGPAF